MNSFSQITTAKYSNQAGEEKTLTHFLYPAAIFTSMRPHVVTTILGSCVSICLWDPILRIGGINHYMLPLWNGKGLASPKYGNFAIPKLAQKLNELGSQTSNIKAKVFGGAEVIDTKIKNFNIGLRNIEIAKETLADLKIPILSASLGGKQGRKIQFNTETGEVRLKYVARSTVNT